MAADQTSGAASLLLLLMLGLIAAYAGLGIMMGAGSNKEKSGGTGGGMNVGKIVTLLVVGLVLAMWLSTPGTGYGIAAAINAIWGNIVIGLQPLVAIVTQLAMLAAIGTVGYLMIRRSFRRR